MNHLLLYSLSAAIAPHVDGSRLEFIRSVGSVLAIRLVKEGAPHFLVVLTATPGPFCYLAGDDPLGTAGEAVLKRVFGSRVKRVSAAATDRIIHFELEGKRAETVSIYLYGNTAKVRIESQGTIIESTDPRENGRTQNIQPRTADNWTTMTSDQLRTELSANTPGSIPGLPLEMLNLFKEDDATNTDALHHFREQVKASAAPFFVGTTGRLGAAFPVPTPVTEPKFTACLGPFQTVREACTAVGEQLVHTSFEKILTKYQHRLQKYLTARARLADKLRGELDEAKSFDVGRNEANILAAFQSQIPGGVREIELPDIYAPGQKTTIQLDPGVPIDEQIKKRFKRAAKLERSRVVLAQRIQLIDTEMSELRKLLADVEHEPRFDRAFHVLERAAKEHRLRDRSRSKKKGAGDAARQLRRFDLDESWHVIVGRSNRENDEVTFKVARPDNIWMHAQNVAGSHVVIKSTGGTGNPPSKILEAAAAIAAFYSKARHSSIVPVIYTLRKYVRKPRGAPAGTVVCEREKTLFVEPKLPDSNK